MSITLKKAFSIALVAVVIFASAPLRGLVGIEVPNLFNITAKAVETGECGENISWNFNTETGELYIDGFGAMTNWSSPSYVPWYNFRTKIYSVIISDDVTSVGSYAFYDCSNLVTAVLSNNVSFIFNQAFSSCKKLKEIIIPNNVTGIGDYAFSQCSNL